MPETRLVRQLSDALALETALAQTLASHHALTPRGDYREALERHLTVTRAHAERLVERLGELGAARTARQRARTAAGQVLSAGRVPLVVLRGTGTEERLLRNARDEAASEALEIATYDALEAFAVAAGDERTAALARDHRAAEEAYLAELRAIVPQLARDVHEADVDTAPPAPPAARVDDVQAAARAAASEVRASARSRRR